MVARAEAKHIRISPFKVRPVLPLIKGAQVEQAMAILAATNKKGAELLAKVLKSAIANASVKGHEKDNLFISNAIANPGSTFRRYRAASFGRATMIQKRTSHLIIELDSKEKPVAVEPKAAKPKAKATKTKVTKKKKVK
jgi:large subunit ribosomal protein L22